MLRQLQAKMDRLKNTVGIIVEDLIIQEDHRMDVRFRVDEGILCTIHIFENPDIWWGLHWEKTGFKNVAT